MAEVSKDPPRFRKYTNGHSYSKRTALYEYACHVCSGMFLGSFDKWYCSDKCREVARRRREAERKT